MNLIDNFRAGALIASGFYTFLQIEAITQTLYTTFIAQPEHAPRSEISPALFYALPAAGGLAALASPALRVDQRLTASVATAAVFLASTSEENVEVLEVLSNIGRLYLQLEASRRVLQALYTGTAALVGRIQYELDILHNLNFLV